MRLVESVFPVGKNARIEKADEIAKNIRRQQEKIEDFEQRMKKWFKSEDIHSLLAYADCKKLMKTVMGRIVGRGLGNRRDYVQLIQRMIRDVVKPKVRNKKSETGNLHETWPEIGYVLDTILSGQNLRPSQ